jgi:xanthine dehydrogenase accessory factor
MAKIQQLHQAGKSPPWLHRLGQMREPVILIFVIRAMGSTPRESSAWMLVTADDQFGTIGGGRLEYQSVAKARQMLDGEDDQRVETFLLGPDLNQCCGGAVDLMLLRVTSNTAWLRKDVHVVRFDDRPPFHIPLNVVQDRLVIYGAGHVGIECALNFARLEFDVTVVDPRTERLAMLPNKIEVEPDDDAVSIDDSYVLVMTHDHQLDFDICRRLLQDGRFSFLGLIGSASKIVRFKKRFREAGLSEQQINRLITPIGLPSIPGKQPATIAISVAAQILEFRAEQASPDSMQSGSLQNE